MREIHVTEVDFRSRRVRSRPAPATIGEPVAPSFAEIAAFVARSRALEEERRRPVKARDVLGGWWRLIAS